MANPDTCSLAGLKPLWQLANEEKEGHWSWEKWIYPLIERKDFLKLNHLLWEGMNGIKGTLYPKMDHREMNQLTDESLAKVDHIENQDLARI